MKIYGIVGVAGSGKDTAAKMINYILQVGTSRATYSDFVKYSNTQSIANSEHNNIFHFADSLKEVLSSLYNINIERFNNRDYKENRYFDLINYKFYTKLANNKTEITFELLKEFNYNLNFCIHWITADNKKPVITLRILMQYFANYVCKNMLGSDIWVYNLVHKLEDVSELTKQDYAIVADIRFKNEVKTLKDLNKDIVFIRIDRYVTNSDLEHTEINKINTNYVIDNNNTKQYLFYRILTILQNENKNHKA